MLQNIASIRNRRIPAVPAASWVRLNTAVSVPSIRRIWIETAAAKGVTTPLEKTMMNVPSRIRNRCWA
jgi:hypothetical protein